MKKPEISFSVEPEEKASIDEYARVKGFGRPSSLARVALFAYMTRSPIKYSTERYRSTAPHDEGISEQGSDHKINKGDG